MYLISQVFIYLALALIIGGAIGFALRACIADTACDDVRDDLAAANARHSALLESQSAREAQQVVAMASPVPTTSRFADMDPYQFERELLGAAPGKPLKVRFGSDDLTAIIGVTPKIDVWLELNGITRFAQIASLSAAELYWLVENLPQNGDTVYRYNWVAQAERLARENQ
jgi:predicted flap endonuclease-1-like 5' DNA nuclease